MDRSSSFSRVRRFLDDLAVISYDRRGYAGSVHLTAVPDLTRHVADLIEIIGSDPTVIIGHSYGGLIALAAAIRAPEQIRAVGVYEPPMPWLDSWPKPPALGSPDNAAERFLRRVLGPETWESLPERVREQRQAEGPALLADFAAARDGLPFDLDDVLSPVAAAHGGATKEMYVLSASAMCTASHGTRVTVIEGAAHGVHMSHPESFADWIRTVVNLAKAGEQQRRG